ncbi:MAG: phytanoyl-CoA dioxygenase family protein, partial [Armatimonadetes bacterium]|nr:phytanoyl-CoA dioxygenase family protein [Armatimonadota bacterium]
MPTHASRRGLAAAELAQFERDGYLLIPDLFDPAELQPLIREIEEVIDQQAARLLAEGLITDPFEGEGFLTRLTRLTAQSDKVYWALAGGQHCGRQMFELIRHPRLLDVAEALLGPEIVASAAYRIRPKVPGFDHGVVPWHQDSGYFEATCDRSLILTVWMPLVNATPENGCLQVIPGMQRGPVVTHHRRAGANYLRIADEDLWLEQTVTVPVPLGGVLLLSNRTPHCSTPNTTDEVRWSVDIRYQGTDAPSPALPAELGAEALARA